MKYSLRSLMIAMLVGPPTLAVLWWLRHTWLIQVLTILVLMLLMVVVMGIGGWLISALIAAMCGLMWWLL